MSCMCTLSRAPFHSRKFALRAFAFAFVLAAAACVMRILAPGLGGGSSEAARQIFSDNMARGTYVRAAGNIRRRRVPCGWDIFCLAAYIFGPSGFVIYTLTLTLCVRLYNMNFKRSLVLENSTYTT